MDSLTSTSLACPLRTIQVVCSVITTHLHLDIPSFPGSLFLVLRESQKMASALFLRIQVVYLNSCYTGYIPVQGCTLKMCSMENCLVCGYTRGYKRKKRWYRGCSLRYHHSLVLELGKTRLASLYHVHDSPNMVYSLSPQSNSVQDALELGQCRTRNPLRSPQDGAT